MSKKLIELNVSNKALSETYGSKIETSDKTVKCTLHVAFFKQFASNNEDIAYLDPAAIEGELSTGEQRFKLSVAENDSNNTVVLTAVGQEISESLKLVAHKKSFLSPALVPVEWQKVGTKTVVTKIDIHWSSHGLFSTTTPSNPLTRSNINKYSGFIKNGVYHLPVIMPDMANDLHTGPILTMIDDEHSRCPVTVIAGNRAMLLPRVDTFDPETKEWSIKLTADQLRMAKQLANINDLVAVARTVVLDSFTPPSDGEIRYRKNSKFAIVYQVLVLSRVEASRLVFKIMANPVNRCIQDKWLPIDASFIEG